jgi:hypothetical protein
MTIACPACRNLYDIDPFFSERTIACSSCGTPNDVPQPEDVYRPGPSVGPTTSVPVSCPRCSRTLRVPSEKVSGWIACSSCSLVFTEAKPSPALPPRSDSMVRFACPTCRKVYRASAGDAGKQMHCKSCGSAVIIPEPLAPKPLTGIPLPSPGDVEPEEEPHPPSASDEADGGPSVPADRPWLRPSRRRSAAPSKPGKLSAIAGMLLGGGVWAICWNLLAALFFFPFFCVWPGFYFGIVWGILAIIRGAGLLGDNWRRNHPRLLVILQIVQIVNLDVVNITLGIIGLVFLNDGRIGPAFRHSDDNW